MDLGDKIHFNFKQYTKGCRNRSEVKEHWMLSKRSWVQFLAPIQCLTTICESSFRISDSLLASDCTRDAHANVQTSRHTSHMQKEVLKREEKEMRLSKTWVNVHSKVSNQNMYFGLKSCLVFLCVYVQTCVYCLSESESPIKLKSSHKINCQSWLWFALLVHLFSATYFILVWTAGN